MATRCCTYVAALLILAGSTQAARAETPPPLELPVLTVPACDCMLEGKAPRVTSFRDRLRRTWLGRFLFGTSCGPSLRTCVKTATPPDAHAHAARRQDVIDAQTRRDDAAIQARLVALRYLGTLPCQHIPEAEAALIAALRSDRHELVRLEAARSLAAGCCPTPRVVEHVWAAAAGATADGYPPEASRRVRNMSALALQRCMVASKACTPSGGLSPARSPAGAGAPLVLASFCPVTNNVAPASASEQELRRWAEIVGAKPAAPAPKTAALILLMPSPVADVPGESVSPRGLNVESSCNAPSAPPDGPPALTYIGQVAIPSSGLRLVPVTSRED